MLQEQQQQTNQWVLTPVQFNLVCSAVTAHKSQGQFHMTPTIGLKHWKLIGQSKAARLVFVHYSYN